MERTDSRTRFNLTIKHRTPDRTPVNYFAHTELDRKIKEFYGVDTEHELLDVLGCDFYFLSCRDISQNESCLPFYRGPELKITDTQRQCPFGFLFSRGALGSKFRVDEAIKGPLENAASEKNILKLFMTEDRVV